MTGKRVQSKIGIFLQLSTKFLIGIILLECVTMGGTIMVVELQMRHSILDQFLKLGTAIGKNLSAVNANFVTTYNYVGIEQNVAKAVKDNDLAYALIQFFDGEIAAYSGDETIKRDVISRATERIPFENGESLIRYFDFETIPHKICDIAVPVIIRDKQWATVHLGLSLERIHVSVKNTRKILSFLGIIALVIGCLGSILFARRITRPVAALVNDVEAVSNGNYEQEIRIHTRDEIGYLAHRFGSMKENLKKNIKLLKDSNQELSQTNQRLQSLFQASQAMSAVKNQDRLYDLILEAVLGATEALGASLAVVEPDAGMRVAASIVKETCDPFRKQAYKKLLEAQSFFQQSCFFNESFGSYALNLEYFGDSPFFKTSIGSYPNLEIFSMPLGSSYDLSGYISLVRNSENPVSTSEIQTLSVLASQITTSIENNKLFGQLEQAYLSSIKSLVKTLEFKDQYTHGHAERVAEICKKIGKRMNMDQKALQVLYNAALLHDIGKIGVFESILNKKSSLTEDEYQMIKKHPIYGEEILKPILTLKEEGKIVRHHHEREDGKGYPDGLDGNLLSLSEKIIIVADAFDAMDSKRSYRDILTPEIIKNELRQSRGTQFDADVVDIFLEIYETELCRSNNHEEDNRVIFFSGSSVR